jgi:hypothetical protein
MMKPMPADTSQVRTPALIRCAVAGEAIAIVNASALAPMIVRIMIW